LIVSLLVAMDENRGIGRENRLPWRLATDLKRFKTLTMGHHLIMGRKTYESIGKPLPGRTMIVISRNPAFRLQNSFVVPSLDAALDLAATRGEEEAFIIGGGEIFSEALPFASRIYLTKVHGTVQADVFFPPFDEQEWMIQETSAHPAGPKDEFPHTFFILDRRTSQRDARASSR
jgi:dihydrofolate reductase